MGSAITNAINEIKFSIPPEILNIAFSEYSNYGNNVISLDERIMNSVIRPRVLVDANLVGGVQIGVGLNSCHISYLNNREFIADIPKELTNGRSIMTVLGLVSNVMYNQATSFQDMTSAMSSSINMMNNLGSENIVQTAKLELIGDNVILIQDPTIHLMNGIVRCVIENNSNMENINPRSYNAFSKLCILAVKAYIYNTTIVKLDKGYVYGGHDLGIVKDIIESYSDAHAEYSEYLQLTWKKIAFMNDSNSMTRYIKMQLSNTL